MGKRHRGVPCQPGGENVRLCQAGGNQAKRLTVDFAALPNGADSRDGGPHLLVDHNATGAANTAGACEGDVGLYASGQHHARSINPVSVEQRH